MAPTIPDGYRGPLLVLCDYDDGSRLAQRWQPATDQEVLAQGLNPDHEFWHRWHPHFGLVCRSYLDACESYQFSACDMGEELPDVAAFAEVPPIESNFRPIWFPPGCRGL